MSQAETEDLSLRELQSLIREMYGPRDDRRGANGTFLWLSEEVGELAAAIRKFDSQTSESDHEELAEEFADVLAWLATLANVTSVDLALAIRKKYGIGCPGCGKIPCTCDESEKP